MGRDAKIINEAVKNCSNVIHANHLNEVVSKADSLAQPGDIVLFAPACASFDMLKNYEHRRNEFIKLVNALIG